MCVRRHGENWLVRRVHLGMMEMTPVAIAMAVSTDTAPPRPLTVATLISITLPLTSISADPINVNSKQFRIQSAMSGEVHDWPCDTPMLLFRSTPQDFPGRVQVMHDESAANIHASSSCES
jgi:hypothetical protein